MDLTILKEPRGFIRVIQFILSIFAFATVSGPSPTSSFSVVCPKHNKIVVTKNVQYSYPFNIKGDVRVDVPFCEANQKPMYFNGNFAPPSQFFCFVGVMSFLICIAMVIAYVGFSKLFTNPKVAIGDFVFSVIWTVIWFIASVAWADGLSKLGSYMDPSNLIMQLKDYCSSDIKCSPGKDGDHSTLIVSVLFGFLNMCVWGAGLWFLYKETPFHKDKEPNNSNLPQNFDQPHADTTTSSYQAPDYQPGGAQ